MSSLRCLDFWVFFIIFGCKILGLKNLACVKEMTNMRYVENIVIFVILEKLVILVKPVILVNLVTLVNLVIMLNVVILVNIVSLVILMNLVTLVIVVNLRMLFFQRTIWRAILQAGFVNCITYFRDRDFLESFLFLHGCLPSDHDIFSTKISFLRLS